MKMPKKFDVIIFFAVFICCACLAATVAFQQKMKNELSDLSLNESTTKAGTYVYEANAESTDVSGTDGETPTQGESSDPAVEEMEVADNNSQAVQATAKKASTTEKKTTKKETTQEKTTTTTEKSTEIDSVLIINKNSKKIHSSTCSSVKTMKDENKITISSDELQAYLDDGYEICSRCQCYVQ